MATGLHTVQPILKQMRMKTALLSHTSNWNLPECCISTRLCGYPLCHSLGDKINTGYSLLYPKDSSVSQRTCVIRVFSIPFLQVLRAFSILKKIKTEKSTFCVFLKFKHKSCSALVRPQHIKHQHVQPLEYSQITCQNAAYEQEINSIPTEKPVP